MACVWLAVSYSSSWNDSPSCSISGKGRSTRDAKADGDILGGFGGILSEISKPKAEWDIYPINTHYVRCIWGPRGPHQFPYDYILNFNLHKLKHTIFKTSAWQLPGGPQALEPWSIACTRPVHRSRRFMIRICQNPEGGEWKFHERVKDSWFSNQCCRLRFTSDWKFSKKKKKRRPICQGGLQKIVLSMAWNANEEDPGPKGPTFRRRN